MSAAELEQLRELLVKLSAGRAPQVPMSVGDSARHILRHLNEGRIEVWGA